MKGKTMIVPDCLEGENTLVLNKETVKNIISAWMKDTMFEGGVEIVSVDKRYEDFEITFAEPKPKGDETNVE